MLLHGYMTQNVFTTAISMTIYMIAAGVGRAGIHMAQPVGRALLMGSPSKDGPKREGSSEGTSTSVKRRELTGTFVVTR